MCELTMFICVQIAQHHTLVVQQIAKYQGWQVLAANSSIGSGDMESFATASSISIASPRGDKYVDCHSTLYVWLLYVKGEKLFSRIMTLRRKSGFCCSHAWVQTIMLKESERDVSGRANIEVKMTQYLSWT